MDKLIVFFRFVPFGGKFFCSLKVYQEQFVTKQNKTKCQIETIKYRIFAFSFAAVLVFKNVKFN